MIKNIEKNEKDKRIDISSDKENCTRSDKEEKTSTESLNSSIGSHNIS